MATSIGVQMPSTVTTASVPTDVVKLIDAKARAEFGSRSAVIRQILVEWAKSHRDELPKVA
jgi:Arc/MetJ-type ribon-helix-helix transcriptional regulator